MCTQMRYADLSFSIALGLGVRPVGDAFSRVSSESSDIGRNDIRRSPSFPSRTGMGSP